MVAACLGPGCPQGQGRAVFWVTGFLPDLTWWRGRGSSLGVLCKGTDPTCGAAPSRPQPLPQAHLLTPGHEGFNACTCGVQTFSPKQAGIQSLWGQTWGPSCLSPCYPKASLTWEDSRLAQDVPSSNIKNLIIHTGLDSCRKNGESLAGLNAPCSVPWLWGSAPTFRPSRPAQPLRGAWPGRGVVSWPGDEATVSSRPSHPGQQLSGEPGTAGRCESDSSGDLMWNHTVLVLLRRAYFTCTMSSGFMNVVPRVRISFLLKVE